MSSKTILQFFILLSIPLSLTTVFVPHNSLTNQGFSDHKPFELSEPDWLKNFDIYSLWDRKSINTTDKCYQDWLTILSYDKLQVAKFWDSFAVVGTGLLEGNRRFLGQPEECVNSKRGFFAIEVVFPETEPFLVAFPINDALGPLFVGVCMPASCNVDDVVTIVRNMNVSLPIPVANSSEITAYGRHKFEANTAFTVATVVFGSLITLVLIATVVGCVDEIKAQCDRHCTVDRFLLLDSDHDDISITNTQLRSGPMSSLNESEAVVMSLHDASRVFVPELYFRNFLNCFDFRANFNRIISQPDYKDSKQVPILNGIRVMSLGWVIIGHVLFLELILGSTDNVLFMLTQGKRFGYQVITNGPLSVDTFFVMSGMLVSLGTLRALEKKNVFNLKFWLTFYIHRLIRLWPTLLLTILFVAGFYPYLSRVFYSPSFQPQQDANNCAGTKWLSTAFFFNNLVDQSDSCIVISWYVSNDMMFYILSPIPIILAKKRLIFGVNLISLLVLASSITRFVGTILSNAPPADFGATILANSEAAENYNMNSPWVTRLYFSPYCRFQTYGVGLLLGLAVYNKDSIKQYFNNLRIQIKTRIYLIATVWVLAFALGALALFGCYPTVRGHIMSPILTALYNSTFRLMWATFVSIMILLCCMGYGGIINRFLSSNFWVPFARVNYTTYIIHFTLLQMYFQSLEQPIRYNLINYIIISSGMLACINCLSVVISCFIESPFVRLEKLVFKK